MKDFMEFVRECVFPCTLLGAAFFAIGFAVLCANHAWEASAMRDLGYDAKLSAGDCVAKVNGKWLTCKVALTNVQEIKVMQ